MVDTNDRWKLFVEWVHPIDGRQTQEFPSVAGSDISDGCLAVTLANGEVHAYPLERVAYVIQTPKEPA